MDPEKIGDALRGELSRLQQEYLPSAEPMVKNSEKMARELLVEAFSAPMSPFLRWSELSLIHSIFIISIVSSLSLSVSFFSSQKKCFFLSGPMDGLATPSRLPWD